MRLSWSQGLRRCPLVTRLRARLQGIGGSGSDAEGGSAIVEFVFLAVLLMVPLFYLVMVLARLQAGAYAVSAASREAGRAYVTASAQDSALARAQSAAGLAFADQGFDGPEGRLEPIKCDLNPCLSPSGRITITATVMVPMPLVPGFFARIVATQIPVSATHVETVDRFGGR
jgi:hypothetical protein